MKKTIFALAAIALILTLVTISYARPDEKWKDKLDGDLKKIVENQNRGFSILSAPEKSVDVIVTTSDKNLENFGTVRKKFSIISAVSMSVPASKIEQMARLGSVERITSNYRISAFRMQAIPFIRADSASNDFGINGTNINISIVDTGIYSHTEFQSPNRIVQQKCFCTGCCQPNSVNSNSNATDDNGHGTHVAGIAAGEGGSNGRGVAANSSLFAVKVLDNDGSGSLADVISGIEWSVNNKAKVISMSLGLSYIYFSDCYGISLADAVDNATEQGALVVVAAGNSGSASNTIAAPACAKRSLAVGSVSDTADSLSSFSSRGATNDNRTKPDLAAPGSMIISTVPPNNYCTGTPIEKSCSDTEYKSLQGTSMSAPFVSGAAALVMEQYNKTFGYFPEPERVKAILLASANTSGMEASGFTNSGTPYRNNYYGSGRLDVYKALRTVNFTSNDSITQGQQKVFYFNATNASSSIVLIWGENSTTYNNLDLIVGNGTNNFTAGADRNDTVEQIFLKGSNIAVSIIYVNGTSVSGTQKFYIAYTQDIYPPQWSANISYPASPANYSKNGNYSFNITWTDDVAVDEIVFEWNNATNYSRGLGNLSAYGSVFAANLTDLAAGNYSFRWLANDTSGKWNSTDIWNYSVARASPNVTILLNNSAGNFTIASGDFVNVTATSAGEGNISLYNSSTLINNTLPPIYNITNYIGAAGTIFNITAFYNQTQNFSSQTTASFIKIDNTPPFFSNNKTSPNSTAPYGMNYQFNITWYDETNISSVILEWNDTTNITNYIVTTFFGSDLRNSTREYYYSLSNLSVGSHAYRWLANDSMNNSNSTDYLSYVISYFPRYSNISVNGTQKNTTALFKSYWNDEEGLSGYIFSTNNTGTWTNQSWFQMTGTANWSNATTVLNSTTGLSISYMFYANNTNGMWNHTGVQTLVTGCLEMWQYSDWSACSGVTQTRTASDSNNCGTNVNKSITQSCSSGSSSSGSSGGSSSGVTVNALAIVAAEPSIKVTSSGESTTVSISSVQANSQQNINITNSSLPIKEITFFPSEASTNAKVEMRVASAPSSQKPEGEVFQYFSIEKTNLSFGNGTVIEFFATKKWISDSGINVSTVALNRLSGNWTRLATAKTGEDSEKFYFKSGTPGFSYFAITGEKAAVHQSQTNETGGSQAKADAGENEKTGSATPVFIGALVIIIIICFLIYVSRKKKIREDRDENK